MSFQFYFSICLFYLSFLFIFSIYFSIYLFYLYFVAAAFQFCFLCLFSALFSVKNPLISTLFPCFFPLYSLQYIFSVFFLVLYSGIKKSCINQKFILISYMIFRSTFLSLGRLCCHSEEFIVRVQQHINF